MKWKSFAVYVLCCFLLCNSVLADFEAIADGSGMDSGDDSGISDVSDTSVPDVAPSEPAEPDVSEGGLDEDYTVGEKVDQIIDKLPALGEPSVPEDSPGELPAEVSPGAKYTADPLCGQDATIGLTREMLRGIRMIQRPANLQRMDKALPVFFIAGKSDPVGNMGRGVERAAAAFRAAGMQDVACKLYDGRHEILNEKNRQLVYDDVLAFYERQLD